MVIEFREAAYDKAFRLLDEVKEHGKATKMAICALEDAMYDCYEASRDSEEEYEDREDFEIPPVEDGDDELEINYRNGSRSAMRRNMRMRYHDNDETNMQNYRMGRRMRRSRRSSRY